MGVRVTPWVNTNQYPITSENTQYFKHLAMADLISGVSPSAGEPVWGKSHPSAPIGGGFSVVQGAITYHSGAGTNDPASMEGRQLRLHSCLVCDNIEEGGGSGQPTTAGEAAMIDRKMDDGKPWTGFVRSSAAGINAGNASGNVRGCEGEDYDETQKEKACVMYFRL